MKWIVEKPADINLSMKLARELELHPIISQILVNRGLTDVKQMKDFFYPSLDQLSDPFCLSGMTKGIDRIVEALKNKEKIMIFGDYDVDGITATALLFLVLRRFTSEVSYHLPNRLSEGYGLSQEGIQDAASNGVSLIISVDCGITGIDEVEFAKTLGIDFIISDHHEPGMKIPDAYSIINPKLDRNVGDLKELAGVGVAFKLAQGLFDTFNQDHSELFSHLDLVALGTIADIVPLIGENRILAKFGLRQLESTSKIGLKALLKIAGIWGQKLESWHIVFILAPRLNAVGRISTPRTAFELLTTHDAREANRTAELLESENRKRKKLDERIFEEALDMIENKIDLDKEKAIILSNDNWHLGVIGIVASRIVERYTRPTILISNIDGEGKGSARSVPGFHLLNAVKECRGYLLKYGGHKYAAGLSILPENIEAFKEAFNKYTSDNIVEEDLVPKLKIAAKLGPEDIDKNLVEWLELFKPYGPDNMRPVFFMENVEVAFRPKLVGEDHLRFKIRTPQKLLNVIGFGFGKYINSIYRSEFPLNIAFVLEFNHFYGYPQVQLRLKDLVLGDKNIEQS
ncbi:single-stranded-DNA-specific exonuclease RecJ [bacterium]|nr:single-stranded-DNA-specific exonuclease RecJ [bacterium]